jgi:hypothetical protein
MDIRNYIYSKPNFLLYWFTGIKHKVLIFICILATILSTAVACNNDPTSISSSAPFFPVQKSGLGGMTAELEGRLEMDDNGCLRVKYFDDNYLLIWPHGFSMRTEGEEIQVIDSNGQVVACVGDKIYIGGGETPGEKAREFIEESIVEQPLPDDCTGPYWIVGGTVETVD